MGIQQPIINIELSIMCPQCEKLFLLTPIYRVVQLYGWKQCPHCKYQWYLGLQTIVKQGNPKKIQYNDPPYSKPEHITVHKPNLWTPLINTFKRILGKNDYLWE